MRARSSVFGLLLYLLYFPIWLSSSLRLGENHLLVNYSCTLRAIRRTLLLVYLLHGPVGQNMWQKYGRMNVVKLALTESDKGPVNMFGWACNSHVQTLTIDALTGINSLSSSVILVYFWTETYRWRTIWTSFSDLGSVSCTTVLHCSDLDYCNSIFPGLPKFQLCQLQSILNCASWVVASKPKIFPYIGVCVRHTVLALCLRAHGIQNHPAIHASLSAQP